MDFSKLSYYQVLGISNSLSASSKHMEMVLNEVKALFDKIGTDDVWSGTAASDAKANFDKLSAKFPEFSKAIADCTAYLNQVVENYQHVDSAIMRG